MEVTMNRKQLLCILCILLGLGGYWFYIDQSNEPNETIITEQMQMTNKRGLSNGGAFLEKGTENKEEGHSYMMVYITGAIENPGLYEIKEGSRLSDVVKSSGGLLPYAGVEQINLAEQVQEGTHIHIPFSFTGHPEELLRKKKVNLNTATLEELKTLRGVGPATAERILSYRKEKGSFTTIEDIQKVKGIGKGIFQKLKDYITV